jgi:hypothetical protein
MCTKGCCPRSAAGFLQDRPLGAGASYYRRLFLVGRFQIAVYSSF